MSIKDIRTKNEIVVSIGGADALGAEGADALGAEGGERRRRGAINPSKKNRDYLPRRTRAGNLINFYDLGQLKNLLSGASEDFPFSLAPPFSYDVNHPAETGNLIRRLTAADFAARDNLVFGISFDDWTARFPRFAFQTAARYAVALFGGTATENEFAFGLQTTENQWTENGLALTAAQLAADRINFAGAKFFDIVFKSYFSGATLVKRNHITTAPNPSADEAVFSLAGQLDIYLMPGLFLTTGGAAFEAIPGNPDSRNFYWLNYLYASYPRSAFLLPSSPYFNQDFTTRTFTNVAPVNSDNFSAAMLGVDFAKLAQNSRVFHLPAGGIAPVPATLSDFPPQAALPPPNNLRSGFNTNYGRAITAHLSDNAPFIIAVIKKGDVWFYVWSNRAD